MKDNKIIYALRYEDVQNEAESYLGRKLNNEEIEKFRDVFCDGMGETISPMYTAIFDMITNG